ncbi:MAG: DUF2723 domain-containing protein [Elusimicrobiota bacterium]
MAFFLSFTVYLATLCPTISVGDSGELAVTANILGIPHAPGYPLYSLLGKIFSLLIPWGNPAYKINLMSAVFASLTVSLIYSIGIKLIKNTAPSPCPLPQGEREKINYQFHYLLIFLPLLLGFSPIFWSQAVVAEVFILNGFFAVLLLWLVFQDSIPLQRKAYLIFFLFGLGLGNHHTLIFLAPAIFLLYFKNREFYRLANLIFLSLGFSVYLFLMIRAGQHPPMNFGHPDNWPGLLAIILRKQFGTFQLHPSTLPFYSGIVILKHAGHYFAELIGQFSLVGFGLGVLGTIVNFRQQKKYFFPLFVSFILSGIFFILWSNLAPNPMAFWRLERFHLLPNLIFILWIFWGIGWLAGFSRLVYFLPVLMLIFSVPKNFSSADRRQHYLVGDLGKNILRTLKPRSSLILDTYLFDEIGSSTAYWTMVEKRRPDLTIYARSGTMFNSLLPNNNFSEEEKLVYLQAEEKKLITDNPLSVYYAAMDTQRLPPAPPGNLPYSLQGLLYSVNPTQPTTNFTAIYQNHTINVGTRHALSLRLDYMERLVALHYPYFQGKFFLQNNEKDKAEEAFRRAAKLGPDMEWLFYNLGVIWSRQGELALAKEAYRESLRIDPFFGKAYFGLGCLEYQQKNTSAARQNLEEAVRLLPDFPPAHYNLGIIYEELQINYLAIEEWKKFIALEPNLPLSQTLQEKINQLQR